MSTPKFNFQYPLGLCICLLLVQPHLLRANPGSTAKPRHANRRLVVGNIALLNSVTPRSTAGGIYQYSVFKSTVTEGEWGNQVIKPPSLYLHMLLTGGMQGFFDDYSVFGQLGLLYRTDRAIPRILGVAVQVVLPERAVGPVLRFEILDLIGIQGGVIYLNNPQEAGWFISIDYYKILFEDLGLR